MLISSSDLGVRRSRFAWWRMFIWALLLFAAWGGIVNLAQAQHVWSYLQSLPSGDSSATPAFQALAWAVGYLLGWFVVIVICAGCILRQAWARAAFRLMALVLIVLAAYTAWQQWGMLHVLDATVAASGQAVAGQDAQLIDQKRILMVSLGLRLIAALLLLWLSWQLGQPAVRLQFKARRR